MPAVCRCVSNQRKMVSIGKRKGEESKARVFMEGELFCLRNSAWWLMIRGKACGFDRRCGFGFVYFGGKGFHPGPLQPPL